MKAKMIFAALLVCALVGTCFGGCIEGIFGDEKPVLLMATTTSTQDTGLLDYLKPLFEQKYNCTLVWTAVGTGQALEIGKRGDADILLVHSPASEKKFVSDGFGGFRYQVMYNYFTILGPSSDPAGIEAAGAASNATKAMKLIYRAGSAGNCKFISRGDNSGTHTKEQALWKAAGYNYTAQIATAANAYNKTTGTGWYYSAGAGMGTCLTMASEMQSYIFTDEGTYFSYMANLDLKQIVKNDTKNLKNQYGVIVVNHTRLNPTNHTSTDANISYNLAVEFADWIVSPEIQEKIKEYTIGGRRLFTPNANGIKNP
ncbi:MAG: substrate-binding domain-containing protein [Candidatus Thermoplasmatota archaeon]|nr:substrate-binding domain-containing protein [Candidatus Thermoplasmatota archaeon]